MNMLIDLLVTVKAFLRSLVRVCCKRTTIFLVVDRDPPAIYSLSSICLGPTGVFFIGLPYFGWFYGISDSIVLLKK